MGATKLFFLLVVMSLTGCGSAARVHQDHSVSELTSSYSEMSSQTFDEIFSEIPTVDKASVFGRKFFLNPSTAVLVDFGEYKSPAILVERSAEIGNELSIESFVVEGNQAPAYLFYPIITLFDRDMQKISEVLPIDEFRFYNNVLQNVFTIPDNAAYFLIHTSPEFTGMSFNESQSYSGTINPTGIAVAGILGGAIGGAIGGAVYGAMSAGGSGSNSGEFVFSVGGAITIASEER